MSQADGTQWFYEYDPKWQLTFAGRYLADSTAVPGMQFGYEYDEIGNTVRAGVLDESGVPLHRFLADDFNFHTNRFWGNRVPIRGNAAEGIRVTVNGIPAQQAGEPALNRAEGSGSGRFSVLVPVDNAAGSLETNLTVWAVKTNVTPEIAASASGTLYVAQAVEPVSHRLSGTMSQDSRFAYEWNRFGRLVSATSVNASPNFKLTFDYYADGRRAKKSVFENVNGQWSLVRCHEFHYDGWNLIGESVVRGPSSVVYSYLWGLDLAGQRTGRLEGEASAEPGAGGAGGIGGLLAVTVTSNGVSRTYLPLCDHSGTIRAVLDADTGAVVAEYEYSPFGVLIGIFGPRSDICNLRFQSKYYDSETELYYFGYRYYDPASCKWLSRDPLGEFAGPNQTLAFGNDPVNNIDPRGLRAYGNDFVGPIQEPYDWREDNYTQEEVDKVYAYLAERDRHIYNTGLANLKETREANRALLERVLGVPVEDVWNPTFGQIGSDIGTVGKKIGRRGWHWSPLKMAENVIGGAVEVAGAAIEVAGYGMDWAVAPVEKVPVIRKAELTHILTRKAYEKALAHVMSQKDKSARVWAWMHSEGAIHGLAVFANMSKGQRERVSGYTFGGGAGAIPEGMDIERLGLRSNNKLRRLLLIDRDGVALVAGGGMLRDYTWMDVDEGYVHGFDVYLRTWVPLKAREYFEDNARKILHK
jgi:RHS repeat-associated protein